MKKIYLTFLVVIAMTGIAFCQDDTSAGWIKYDKNPVLGGSLGTIFDISVLKESAGYRMWCSWRPKKSIALSVSSDGFSWSNPEIVLPPNAETDWEKDINRPGVIKRNGLYHLWYTGQAQGHSWIGYATSKDGLNWKKHEGNPVFKNDPKNEWEQAKVTACQIIKEKNEYLMFYIGFRDVDYAQIGIAKSKDGISNWQRHPQNPIIRPGKGWDASAVYKPYAIYDGKRWLLWYNGRNGGFEQIGVAVHEGKNLGF